MKEVNQLSWLITELCHQGQRSRQTTQFCDYDSVDRRDGAFVCIDVRMSITMISEEGKTLQLCLVPGNKQRAARPRQRNGDKEISGDDFE